MSGEHEYPVVAEGLRKTFRHTRRSGLPDKLAVDGVSFNVRKGEIFGLLGPNGAGKTTTIKMLSTLLIPDEGSVRILGMDGIKDVKNVRQRINLVSGGERGLYYRLTGRQNLRFFANLYDIAKVGQEALIDKLLDIVGLTEAADIKVEDYSRGMKQRMHIARALVNDPEILYLDEPTIGLDPEIARDVRSLIRKLAGSGKTILLTTHYMFEAEELCDRIMIISKGRSVGYGTVAELKKMVPDTNIIEVVTNDDPHDTVAKLSSEHFIQHVNTERIAGRHCTRIQLKDRTDLLSYLDTVFSKYGIRKIGYDEPTLEDIYISLVGGEGQEDGGHHR
ncbi:MAG: ABC transporter ATP-binding protein [Methanomassiliicoccaceae archaeon]|jgi:ABC-2 type transport system ATP-binding protein|nr:ABC transporter ATP-binding protein [Methanomassiliicoccaceae archaeon]